MKNRVESLFSLHLLEIQYRALYFFLSFLITFLIGMQQCSSLTHLMCSPFSFGTDSCSFFIFTHVYEGLYATLHVDLIYTSLFCTPVFFYHLYSFFIPSCYQRERTIINWILFVVFLLFICSLYTAAFFVLPKILHFFRQFQHSSPSLEIQLQARIAPAVRWSCTTFLLTALFFQIPVIFGIVLKWGMISRTFLREKRKHAFFFILLIASFLSPPDVSTQCVLAVFGFFIYEFFLWCAFFYHFYCHVVSNEWQKARPGEMDVPFPPTVPLLTWWNW